MTIYEIPFFPELARFRQGVELGGKIFELAFRINDAYDRWYMDIFDVEDKPIVMGVLLQTGVALLYQVKRRYEGVLPDGDFYVFDATGQNREPTWLSMKELSLYYVAN